MSASPDPDRVVSIVVAPECCGEPMLVITTDLDRTLGALRWECCVCGFEMLGTPQVEDPPLPSRPTGEAAGSPGKVEVMRARANKKEQLFHPSDSCELAPPNWESNRIDGRSLPAGVSWDASRRCYRARVTLVKGQGQVYLGKFPTVEEAVAAIELAKQLPKEGR